MVPLGSGLFSAPHGLSIYKRDLLPSLLVGTSVTSLGNALGAINFEPISGIDLFAGVGSAHSVRLANGMTVDTPIGVTSATTPTTPPTLQTVTTVHAGLSVGVAFDLGVFSQIFSKSGGTSAATLP
jgi:hypothetical protein